MHTEQTVDSKGRAVERLLKRLNVAIGAFALYQPPHPITTQATADLLAAVRAYTDAHGRLTIRVTHHALAVDGARLDGAGHARLARHFYIRKVASLTILPAAAEEELTSFLSVVGMEPAAIDAAGGVEPLLWKAGVSTIQVGEIALTRDEELEILGLNAFYALLGRGRLAPQERALVLDVLRAGPDEIVAFLESLRALIRDTAGGTTGDGELERVVEALDNLDRLILDEPAEDQAPLHGNLVEALCAAPEPLRTVLHRAVVARTRRDPDALGLLDSFSAEQLAGVLIGALTREEIAEQVAEFLEAFDQARAGAVLSELDRQIARRAGEPSRLSEVVRPRLQAASVRHHAVQPAPDPAPGPGDIEPGAIDEAGLERLLAEAGAIDDAGATRDAVRTLADAFCRLDDEHDLADVADSLEGHLPALVHQREFAFLSEVLHDLGTIAASAEPARRDVAGALLEAMAEPPVLRALLAAMQDGRDGVLAGQARACLQAASSAVVAPLVRLLGLEPRTAARAQICDLLAEIGRDHVDDLGAFVSDDRWYLVRNVARVLGRIGGARAAGYLGRLTRHPEYRVRREVVAALAGSRDDEAQAALAAFLDDPDERLQLAALRALGAGAARQALPRLLALLEARDPTRRLFELRRAAVKTVEGLGAAEALPALRRIAHGRVVFGRRARELRRLAGDAAASIEARLGQRGHPRGTAPVLTERRA